MTHQTIARILGSAVEWAIIITPLTIYLLTLSVSLNAGRHPVMIRGRANMLGLLFALSGFFLFGPVSWLAYLWPHEGVLTRQITYAAYVLILLALSIWLLRGQRRVYVIYGIDPQMFGTLLDEHLAERQIEYSRTPNRYSFQDGRVTLDVETMWLLSNVTMRWSGADDPICAEITDGVRARLSETIPSHRASNILAGVGLFMLLCVVATGGVSYFFGPQGVEEVLEGIFTPGPDFAPEQP